MISVTMDVSPFAWCLARAVLKMSILTFMSRINVMLSRVGHGKRFKTLRPGW